MIQALGTIVKLGERVLTEDDYYCGIFDYYDVNMGRRNEVDPRLASHYPYLSQPAWAVAKNLNNMAIYVGNILFWLDPTRIQEGQSVLIASAMMESYVSSARAACDALAAIISYQASVKPLQAITRRLPMLIKWVKNEQNKDKVRPEILELLSGDFSWFFRLRQLRNSLSHELAHANVYRDTRQFYLWMMYEKNRQEARVPLLPILATQLIEITSLANRAAEIINALIDFPRDRVRSRVLNGLFVSELHRLINITQEYSVPIEQQS